MDYFGKPPYAMEMEPDEPVRSWLLRMACFAGAIPEEMDAHLRSYASGIRYERDHIIQVPSVDTWAGGGVLAAMTSYCPLCLSDDMRRGRLPHFRRQHQALLRTHCRCHLTPLLFWPYRYGENMAYLPRWVGALHARRQPLVRFGDENHAVILQLQQIRRLRRLMHQGDGDGLAWLQQLDIERALLGRFCPSRLLGGAPQTMMPRLINDCATLLASQFGASECAASSLSAFLGPKWLFATRFCDGYATPARSVRGLASFADPAQRRSLLSLSYRMLFSFGLDPQFEPRLGAVGTGCTRFTKALDHLPKAAFQWAHRRSADWPALVRFGFRDACRDRSLSWAAQTPPHTEVDGSGHIAGRCRSPPRTPPQGRPGF